MITVRSADSRGTTKLDWLDSRHSFSFAEYYDPVHMGFGPLRVINEDVVAPGQGFGPHPHKDMEIITYVLEGALEHRDSMGHGQVINAGEVQRMTAGKGVVHSEFNHSTTDPVHFLQIWITPSQKSLPPGYEQKPLEFATNEWCEVAGSGDGAALQVHQDLRLLAARVSAGKSLAYKTEHGSAWVQVVRGMVNVNGRTLGHGDGASITEGENIALAAVSDAEVLLFDLRPN